MLVPTSTIVTLVWAIFRMAARSVAPTALGIVSLFAWFVVGQLFYIPYRKRVIISQAPNFTKRIYSLFKARYFRGPKWRRFEIGRTGLH